MEDIIHFFINFSVLLVNMILYHCYYTRALNIRFIQCLFNLPVWITLIGIN